MGGYLEETKSITENKKKQNGVSNSASCSKMSGEVDRNTGIPGTLKSNMERLSGFSLDDIKVHYNSSKPSTLNAYAYTKGNQVHIAPSQEKYLPHEMWHVVQQKQGRVQPEIQLKGVSINRDKVLEHEADVMGEKAATTPCFVATGNLQNRSISSDVAYQLQEHVDWWKGIKVKDDVEKNILVGKDENKNIVQNLGNFQIATKEIDEEVNEEEYSNELQLLLQRDVTSVEGELHGMLKYRENRLKKQQVFQPESIQRLRLLYKAVSINKGKKVPVKSNGNIGTIFFETFGDKESELLNVYKQSCQYDVATVCVIGINAKKDKNEKRMLQGQNKDMNNQVLLKEKTERLFGLLKAAKKKNHEVYIYPFIWEPTEQKTGGYEMPYLEIRGKLMIEAQTISKDQNKPVFRWIDRDVSEDYSILYGEEIIKALTKETDSAILSGAYRWGTSSQDDNYITFLEQLNDAEIALRNQYYKLRDQNYLSSKGMYLPEPNFFMNQAAHNKGIEKLRKNQFFESNAQSRESETLFSDGKVYSAKIKFNQDLQVYKPIKGEGKKDSYLSRLETVWKQQGDVSEEDFYKMLIKIRQSVFDNGQWSFISDQKWNKWGEKNDMSEPKTLGAERAQFELNKKRVAYMKKLHALFNELRQPH